MDVGDVPSPLFVVGIRVEGAGLGQFGRLVSRLQEGLIIFQEWHINSFEEARQKVPG